MKYFLLFIIACSCRGKTIKDWSIAQNPQNSDGTGQASDELSTPPEVQAAIESITEEDLAKIADSDLQGAEEAVPQSSRAVDTLDSLPSLASMQSCDGGSIDGNSGLNITYETNPWYLTQDPKNAEINYCVEDLGEGHKEHFSVELDFIKGVIKESIENWKIYLSTTEKLYNLPLKEARLLAHLEDFYDQSRFSSFSSFKSTFERTPIPEQYKNQLLVKNFKEVSCSQNPKLRFLLGTDDVTIDGKKVNLINHLGFTARTAYDSSTMTSEGFIWISPDKGTRQFQKLINGTLLKEFWGSRDNLKTLLMHELGHVFGFSHASPLKLMDAAYPQTRLFSTREQDEAILDQPEDMTWHAKENIFNPLCYKPSSDGNLLYSSLKNLADPNHLVRFFPDFISELGLDSHKYNYSLMCFAFGQINSGLSIIGNVYLLSGQADAAVFRGEGVISSGYGEILPYNVEIDKQTWVTNWAGFLVVPEKSAVANINITINREQYPMVIEKGNYGNSLRLTLFKNKKLFKIDLVKVARLKELTNFVKNQH